MGLNTMLLRTRTNSPRDSGSQKGQLPNTFSEGVLLELINVLYVEDGKLPFKDWEQLTLGAQIIFNHFKIFGLDMHIGQGGKSHKTECVFYTPPGFIKKRQILPASEDGILHALIERLKIVRETEEENGIQTESECNNLAETRLIVVAYGFISFCAHIKYLGSWLSFSLRDNSDAGRWIGVAKTSMGALARFWDDHHVEMYSKYIIFLEIPCNLLLWVCES